MTLDKPTADAIAVLVSRLRPDWGVVGIMTALGELRDREAGAVAIAAVRAAQIQSNRTPAVIALGGPHWSHYTSTSTHTAPPVADVLGGTRPPPEVTKAGAAAARAALATNVPTSRDERP